MKLHRLTLTDYRGIAHREITFPDRGVIVVCGPNEIGKSSMIEALDLLLEVKDRSSRKEVKAIKPTHADVGSEITAEISSGPYRFEYFKRFNKNPQTALTVTAPRHEQLTGDQAHERVEAILAETLDTDLWHALRVLQSGSTATVDLSGCDALSRALDVAAGEAADSGGAETPLMDRIAAEFGRYFTATGRPTGQWAAARKRLAAAEAELARCGDAVADVDERTRRHAELSEQLAAAVTVDDAAQDRLVDARAAAAEVDRLRTELGEAELAALKAKTAYTEAHNAHAERLRLAGELDSKTTELVELDDAAASARTDCAQAAEAAAAAEAAEAGATATVDAAAATVEKARRLIDDLTACADAERLAARLARIDALEADRDRIDGELAAITLTGDGVDRIEDLAGRLEVAAAARQLAAATVAVTAVEDVDLVVDGAPLSLRAGQQHSAAAPIEIALAKLVRVRVDPGAAARESAAEHTATRQRLDAALADAGVADVAEARRLAHRRENLLSERARVEAVITEVCGADLIDDLRKHLKQLSADLPEQTPNGDAETARAELTAAHDAHRAALQVQTQHRAVTASADRRLIEHTSRADMLAEQARSHRAVIDELTDRLAAARALTGDAALADAATATHTVVQEADRRAAESAARLADAQPDAVAAELEAAGAAAREAGSRREQIALGLRDVEAQLEMLGGEGRYSALEVADADHAHAVAEHRRIQRCARAAQLLHTVMTRHRDDSRSRYVAPFRTEIERLARPVFGADFAVEIDIDLTISSRTLDGRTVPYDSLSGGAKEQLGILSRLAGAALVAEGDAVPVLIDDALGFTDPDRLVTMGTVFATVGTSGQVIVLTCTPGRYDSVDGAHRIDLAD
ncbi:AAA family ATPase [Mycobacterium koreense]|uniref:Endonuclease GajA/Old nuclease/RecF-like AAA domain-containing protein n=1 Tax=Mycolicibacillus koreensis TaxID=1069220 RepID=A0A7I7S7L0_9MYCO|nr:ATP-binding protein [Mycolicibacillus koreensis]MCV7249764.1 AAA family ATPase [Mycolicibacillus koreensis]ODR08823.1 hypothetical protein BHQ15_08100 [Mycolicibacillus koreensis]OSC32665.1 hypothetical protein B8W67_14775 [Mycolicibacillus koreensis]BBY52872.1 hypothetical protein MKOR_01230 [Mycolicibacillus koreensis]